MSGFGNPTNIADLKRRQQLARQLNVLQHELDTVRSQLRGTKRRLAAADQQLDAVRTVIAESRSVTLSSRAMVYTADIERALDIAAADRPHKLGQNAAEATSGYAMTDGCSG